MRIAVLSDLHANAQALEAVMNDVVNQNCEHVFCLELCVWVFYFDGRGVPHRRCFGLRGTQRGAGVPGNRTHPLFEYVTRIEPGSVRSVLSQIITGLYIACPRHSGRNPKYHGTGTGPVCGDPLPERRE